MSLLTRVVFVPRKVDVRNVSPQNLLAMLKEAKEDLIELDASFSHASLRSIMELGESGKYELVSKEGRAITEVSLSALKMFIEDYRKVSEGGCSCCQHLGREVIDAQDASVGSYCEVDDPDYDSIKRRVRYEGFSSKVRKHYSHPCEAHTPRLSPKIEELLD